MLAKRTKLRRGGSAPPLRFWPQQRRRRRRLGQLAFAARPFLLLAIALVIWPTVDARLVEPPALLATEPETVSRTFSRCGRGQSSACVVDGDTIRLGDRRIRIIGIDTPETEARCPAEARAAEAAAARLQELLSAQPFEMIGRFDDPTDRYGRELKALRRLNADGSHESIGAILREEGHARRYLGGFRSGWC